MFNNVCDEIYKKMQVCDFARIATEKYILLLGVFFFAQGAIIADATKMTWQFVCSFQITSKISNLDNFHAELAKKIFYKKTKILILIEMCLYLILD